MTESTTRLMPENDHAGSESTLTVVVAFLANLAMAFAKTVVATATGSASMLAESFHSWADTGNQVLLLVADRRGRRSPDPSHPFGYGREAYVWSMLAAVGLFIVGAVVSIWNGVTRLTHPADDDITYFWAYVVLGLAFCFEGISFVRAFRQTRREAAVVDRDVLQHALATSDPTLRAVLAEDSAALVGVVIAGLGIALHQLTGDPAYDAAGSILVGLLLGVVAVVLINQNRRFLTGLAADDGLHQTAIDLLTQHPAIDRLTYLRLEFVGPRQLLLLASVDLAGDAPESRLAYQLRDLERWLEQDPSVTQAVLTLATPDDRGL